jgi:hypothetical protein
MKKFGEYITESQDYTIAEERLRLIDEAVVAKIGPEGVETPKVGPKRPVAGRIRRLGSMLKSGLKTYGADVAGEVKTSIGQGLGFDIASRIGRIGRRKRYVQPQFQQSQMPGGEKLQPRSSGGY